MSKRKFARIAAVLTTLVATVALISTVVMSTGAYFTDSHSGKISGTNGNVAVSVSGGGGGAGGLSFDFTGLLPGVPKTATITVQNTTGNPEAVWLVFSNDNGMWSAVNNLGQYGKFTVGGYVYDNLNNKYTPATPGVLGTGVGTYMSGSCSTVERVGANYLPHAIKIASLASGVAHSFNITFEYNPCMTEHQLEAIFNPAEADWEGGSAVVAPGPLKFSIAGYQDGVDPTSPFNGLAAISTLDLSTYGPFDKQYIQP